MFIFLNNSRVITLCLVLLALLYVMDTIKKGKRWVIVLALVSLVLVFFLPSRVSQMFLSGHLMDSLRSDPRAEIWPAVWDLIWDHPLLGYGLDNIENPLVAKYMECGFVDGVAFAYAPHNEYLSEWLQLGLPGLLLWVLLLLSLLKVTCKEERHFWIPFVVVFSIVSFTESLLDRYHGCLTLSFFVVMFSLRRSKESDSSVGMGFFMSILLSMVLAVAMFLLVFMKVRCFSPEMVVSLSGNKDESGVFELREPDLTTFMHEGRCVSYKAVAFCDLKEGEHRTFQLECLTSEDFDASTVKIVAEKDLEDGTHIPTESLYDLGRRSEWQTLSVDVDGKQTIILYIFGDGKFSFGELKGNVFFKNPRFFNN